MNNKKQQDTQLSVNASSFIGSLYSQMVNITVTDLEFTLEFIYVNPRDFTKAEVVSRITLPRRAAEELPKMIQDVVKQHEEKKKKGAN